MNIDNTDSFDNNSSKIDNENSTIQISNSYDFSETNSGLPPIITENINEWSSSSNNNNKNNKNNISILG